MKRILSFVFIFSMSYTLLAQPVILGFNNMGASVYMMPGSLMVVKGDSLFNHSGLFQNGGDLRVDGDIWNTGTLTGSPTSATGLYDIGGNWVNNGTVISHQDSVMLNGNAQFIDGTQKTDFHHLILAGTSSSVKTQNIKATVDGILDLRDHELATQQYEMLVLNTNQNAITKGSGANGYVSSLGAGRLSRSTNVSAPYFYPTGTPSSITTLPFYYRPIDMTPAVADVYGAMVAHDPTGDNHDVTKMDTALCAVNPLFYHNLYNSANNTVAIKMYYNAAVDGPWTDMAHWKSNNRWNYMGTPTAGSAPGFSTLQISGWNDFNTSPFALASKRFTVEAGPDQTITAGQSATLNPVIGTADVATVGWTPPLYLDFPNSTNPVSTPPQDMTYLITVTNSVGCSAHDSTHIKFLPDGLLIPTAFSPNEDGTNDLFRPLNKNLDRLKFIVYNRWGEKIFETDVPGDGWDGKYKGVRQDIGVYVWKAEYTLSGIGKQQTTSGNVTLVK